MDVIHAGQISQLFPRIEHRVLLSRQIEPLIQSLDGAHLRNVGVGQDAVTVGINGMEKRHMARKRNRRHNRARMQRVGAFVDALLHFLVSTVQHGVGTHAVNQNQNHFVCHVSVRSFILGFTYIIADFLRKLNYPPAIILYPNRTRILPPREADAYRQPFLRMKSTPFPSFLPPVFRRDQFADSSSFAISEAISRNAPIPCRSFSTVSRWM